MNTEYISVPNIEKWQHYKDRCPPWIKLHRDILNDYKYSCLQDASKLHLIMIWLLASQMDNKIPNDPKWIASRINATNKIDLKLLIKHGFLAIDSGLISDCKQSDIAETEAETEAERKKDKAFQAVSFLTALGVEEQIAKDFLKVRKTKRAADTETAFNTIKREIEKKGLPANEIIKICVEKSWAGFKASWDIGDKKEKEQKWK